MTTKQLPAISDLTYRIEEELGSGGGGIVYKAWHTRLQKHVVIKELQRGAAHPVEVQRNEVESLKNVKSVFLPQVFDIITEGERVFTVIEFIEGESFDKCLDRGDRFTQPQIVKWYGQLASALEEIHSRGIYHRDIKPANIMLTPGGDACLIDFNAALVNGNDAGMVSRSLGYASPEQYGIFDSHEKQPKGEGGKGTPAVGASISDALAARGPISGRETEMTELLADQEVADRFAVTQSTELIMPQTEDGRDGQGAESIDAPAAEDTDWKRSDIYSLGATMYHLLTGQRPHTRAAQVIPVSELGRFGGGIVYIIERSMRLDPSERFASTVDMAKAIQRIYKYDKRWKSAQKQKITATLTLSLLCILFAIMAYRGNAMLALESDERDHAQAYKNEKTISAQAFVYEQEYIEMLYAIESAADPQHAYETARSIRMDRIDHYGAMTKRLWNDGDMEACRLFIEGNLNNISQFENIPDAREMVRDIYSIWGDCYLYQVGEPDYLNARNTYERVLQFSPDDPAFYLHYAISLIKTGTIPQAEQIIERADKVGMTADYVDLLQGELEYSKREYHRAISKFEKAISQSDDEFILYQAYRTVDDIYRELEQPKQSITFLEDAAGRVPISRTSEMARRLSEAYQAIGDVDMSIEVLRLHLKDHPDDDAISLLVHDLTNELAIADMATPEAGRGVQMGNMLLACSPEGDWLYHADINNGFQLYAIKTDGTDRRLLCSDSIANFCVVGNRIYYTNWNDGFRLYSMQTDGSDKQKLTDRGVGVFCIVDDKIYYTDTIDNAGFYAMNTDGTGMYDVCYDETFPVSLYVDDDGWVYFSNRNDNYRLYAIQADGSDRKKICDNSIGSFTSDGERIYYSDQENGWNLFSMKMDGTDKKRLSNDALPMPFKIDGDWIYYGIDAGNDMRHLYKIKTDGSLRQKLSDDSVSHTHVVGDMIYYVNGTDGDTLYAITTAGGDRRPIEQTDDTDLSQG